MKSNTVVYAAVAALVQAHGIAATWPSGSTNSTSEWVPPPLLSQTNFIHRIHKPASSVLVLHYPHPLDRQSSHPFTMRSSLALAFSAAAVVCAQSVPKYDSALNMTIEPSSVDAPLRGEDLAFLIAACSSTNIVFKPNGAMVTSPSARNCATTTGRKTSATTKPWSSTVSAPTTALPPVCSTTRRRCLSTFAKPCLANASRNTRMTPSPRRLATTTSSPSAPGSTPPRTPSREATTQTRVAPLLALPAPLPPTARKVTETRATPK
jgi:hypothetical protein